MKIILCVLDGLADSYNKNTPLSQANLKFLNSLLNKSFAARLLPLSRNYWPKFGGSSVSGLANLGILGYKVKANRLKRGPLEAIGSDTEFKNGWLAIRVDFASMDKNGIIIDRRAGRVNYGLDKISQDIQKIKFEVPFIFKRTYGHRAVLIFKQKLSPYISDSDPLKIGLKVKKIKPLKNDFLSLQTSKLINKFLEITNNLLANHPVNFERQKLGYLQANVLLTREAGNDLPFLKSFSQKYNFKNCLTITEYGAMRGSCILAGFKTKTLPEIDNLEKRWKKIEELLKQCYKNYEFIYIHFKELDEASHDKLPAKKKLLWEMLDSWFKKNIVQYKAKWVITGDHLTDSRSGRHKFGPVPLFIYPSLNSNKLKKFDEFNLKKSRLFSGDSLWRQIKNI